MLQLVADSVDGKLDPCDDGYVICILLPKPTTGEQRKIDFIYSLEGNLEETKYC